MAAGFGGGWVTVLDDLGGEAGIESPPAHTSSSLLLLLLLLLAVVLVLFSITFARSVWTLVPPRAAEVVMGVGVERRGS